MQGGRSSWGSKAVVDVVTLSRVSLSHGDGDLWTSPKGKPAPDFVKVARNKDTLLKAGSEVGKIANQWMDKKHLEIFHGESVWDKPSPVPSILYLLTWVVEVQDGETPRPASSFPSAFCEWKMSWKVLAAEEEWTGRWWMGQPNIWGKLGVQRASETSDVPRGSKRAGGHSEGTGGNVKAWLSSSSASWRTLS